MSTTEVATTSSGRVGERAAAWAVARPRAVPLQTAGLIGAFILLTLVMTWPLPRYAGSAVQDLGDPLYEIWTMRWAQHQILNDRHNLWDGNVGYPFERSFLFSEPRLSTSLLAWPVYLLSGNEVLAYNAMFLLSFVALGAGMALLVREITGNAGAGLLAGIVAAFTPYRYGHLSHLNLLSYGWLPLGLWALLRFARRRSPLDAALAAFFLTVQVLASDTLALMAAGVVALALPPLAWRARRRRPLTFLAGLLVALVPPALAAYWLATLRLDMNARYGFSRDLDTVREMAATPASYISISPGNAFWGDILPVAYPNPLFPGAVAVAAALLGLTLGLWRWPAWALFALGLVVVGAVLSLGPETEIAGRVVTLPYLYLYQHVPGFTAIRDVARFGMVALLGVQLLAGLGVAAAWLLWRARVPVPRRRAAGAAALALLALLAVIELRAGVATVEVPRDSATRAVYEWLAEQPPGPVIEFPANGLWADVSRTTRQIYSSTWHWQPVVAAYTSFLPERYIELLVRIHGGTTAASLPNRGNIGLLQDLGIRYVVIHRQAGYDWARALAAADRLPELTRAGDFGNAVAYRLAPGERRPVELSILAPEHAYAGATVVAALTLANENASAALVSLETPEPITAVWIDARGRESDPQAIPVTLPPAANRGNTDYPLPIVAPEAPGRYRLRIDVRAGALEPVELPVEVRAGGPSSGPAPLVLSRLDWERRHYRPGETLDLTLTWEARARPGLSYTVAAQILDRDLNVLAQWDGLPFQNRRPTNRWEAGSVIVQRVRLTVPEGIAPGRYQLMIALYDERQRDLPRLTIELPGGEVGKEGLFGPLIVRPD